MVMKMTDMKVPDLCAQLDRMKFLCDQLEASQGDARRSRELVEQIRLEAEALSYTVCALEPQKRSNAME